MWWKPASSLFCSPRATKAPNHRAVLTLDYTVTGSSLQDTGKHQNARITFSLPSTQKSRIFIKVKKKKDKIKIPSVYRNLLGPEHTLLFSDLNQIAKLYPTHRHWASFFSKETLTLSLGSCPPQKYSASHAPSSGEKNQPNQTKK